MADSQRIDDLRRRVQKDPASIAFAQLAEECRRAGQVEEAVDVCRAGLAMHPGYLSARVTLGRALIELNALDEALAELTTVLKSAPENLAAIRGTAEIHHRRGELSEALAQYRVALGLARNDPDLQQTVVELARQVEPPPPPAAEEGLSFEQIANEFMLFAPPPPVPEAPAAQAEPPPAPQVEPSAPSAAEQAEMICPPAEVEEPPPPSVDSTAAPTLEAADADVASPPTPMLETLPELTPPVETAMVFDAPMPVDAPMPLEAAMPHESAPAPHESVATDVASPADSESDHDWSTPVPPSPDDSGAREEAMRTIAALERWLDAIHVTRAQRSA
jgi:hypothetical protein